MVYSTFGRGVLVNFSPNESIALQAAQRLRQNFLRNVADLALQSGITKRSARQKFE